MAKGAELAEQQKLPTPLCVSPKHFEEVYRWLNSAGTLPSLVGVDRKTFAQNPDLAELVLPLGGFAFKKHPVLQYLTTRAIYDYVGGSFQLEANFDYKDKLKSSTRKRFENTWGLASALENNIAFNRVFEILSIGEDEIVFFCESSEVDERVFFRLSLTQTQEGRPETHRLQQIVYGDIEQSDLKDRYDKFAEATGIIYNALYQAPLEDRETLDLTIEPRVDVGFTLMKSVEFAQEATEEVSGQEVSDKMPYSKPGFGLERYIGVPKRIQQYAGVLDDAVHNRQKYTGEGVFIPRSILIHGEPGTGKTLFAYALAGQIKADRYYYIDANVVFKNLGGAMDFPLRHIVDEARANPTELMVLCVDQVEALSIPGNGSSAPKNVFQMNDFLVNRMDWPDNLTVFVVGKYVNPDPVRSGQFDNTLKLSLPDKSVVMEMLNALRSLKERSAGHELFEANIDWSRIAAACRGFNYGALRELINDALADRVQSGGKLVTEQNILEGIKAFRHYGEQMGFVRRG